MVRINDPEIFTGRYSRNLKVPRNIASITMSIQLVYIRNSPDGMIFPGRFDGEVPAHSAAVIDTTPPLSPSS